MTLIGGLLVVLPFWVNLLLSFKAIKSALALLQPIAKLVPQKIVHHDAVARCLLILICFAVGFLIRVRIGQLNGDWLEQHLLDKIPGFPLIRGTKRRWCRHLLSRSMPTDQFTVFISSSPTPMAGAIYILQPQRVPPVDMPLPKAMVCVTKWGLDVPRCEPRFDARSVTDQ